MRRQKSVDSDGVASSCAAPDSPVPRVEVKSPDGLEERPMFDDDDMVNNSASRRDF